MKDTPAESNGGNGSDKFRFIKLLIHSQVGGWIAACLVFAFVARWVSNDRNLVYQDLWRLRKEAIDQLAAMKIIVQDTNEVSRQNNELLKQVLNKMQFTEWRDRHSEILGGEKKQ
jgi:hypothetical protein